VFPLQQIAHVGVSPSMNLKLISREIIFVVFQPMWSERQTDKQTDRQTTHCGIIALCVVSCGKNFIFTATWIAFLINLSAIYFKLSAIIDHFTHRI